MAETEAEDDDDSPLTVGDFHQIAQKQILNAVFATLAESKMPWNVVEPFLEAGRAVCAGDFVTNARIRIHTQRAEGESWVEAEEAFLGISVSDREDGGEWLSETYWLSDLATADGDRAEVEAVIAGLERTIAKLRDWLASGGTGSSAETEPPPEDPKA
jgi:hypothetical protein